MFESSTFGETAPRDEKIDEMIDEAEKAAGVVPTPKKGETDVVTAIVEAHRVTLEAIVAVLRPKAQTVPVPPPAPLEWAGPWTRTDRRVDEAEAEFEKGQLPPGMMRSVLEAVREVVRSEMDLYQRERGGGAAMPPWISKPLGDLSVAEKRDVASKGVTLDQILSDWSEARPWTHVWDREGAAATCLICQAPYVRGAESPCTGSPATGGGIFDVSPQSPPSDQEIDDAFAEKSEK